MAARLSLVVVLAGLLVTTFAPAASAETFEIAVVRYVESGRLLVEMRALFEWLGWVVDWDPWEHRIDASNGTDALTMWINDTQAWVNGVGYILDVPPRLRWGRTYVPLRFVAEATGCQVDYYVTFVQITQGDNTLIVHIVD